MGEIISVIIVDDHEIVRKGIRAYLESTSEFSVLGDAGSGRDAIQLVAELVPDVVLMDLIMPGMDGIQTTREIKKISPRSQIVVLTSFHEDVPLVAERVLRSIRGEDPAEGLLYAELTERELEVLKLIANALSNSQIAEQLVISESTVKGHVSNILSKLHLVDRTQAAVYAWQKGLVKRDEGLDR
jgi:NarL family two-component system response regulator LiaR